MLCLISRFALVLPTRRGVVQLAFIESLLFTGLVETENDKDLLSRIQQAVLPPAQDYSSPTRKSTAVVIRIEGVDALVLSKPTTWIASLGCSLSWK